MSPKNLPKTLTKEEALALLSQPNKNAPTGLRNRCIMQVMYRAGLREGEVINLESEKERGKGSKQESSHCSVVTSWRYEVAQIFRSV